MIVKPRDTVKDVPGVIIQPVASVNTSTVVMTARRIVRM